MDCVSTVDLSVVVLNYRTPEGTITALESAFSSGEGLSIESIVVDNSSKDGSVEQIRQKCPFAKVVELPENRGFAAGMNAGIKASSGVYILLLNSDVEALDGSVKALCDFMASNSQVGIAAPLLVNADGSPSRTLLIEPTPSRALLPLAGKFHYNQWRKRINNVPLEVEATEGAALIIRRSAVEQGNLLDEEFFFYYEIVDWCMRFKAMGHRVFVVPCAKMKHLCGGSTRSSAARIEFKRSEYILLRKHFGKRLSAIVQLKDAFSELANVIFYFCLVALTFSSWQRGAEKLQAHRHLLRWYAAGKPARGTSNYDSIFGSWD